MTDLKKMVETLSESNGTSGNENEIADLIIEYLGSEVNAEKDRNGNVIGTLIGKGKTILLEAHMDRIGLIVTSVEKDGFLRVAKCGGMDARVLAAQDVTVWGREEVYGVITSTPPHLAKAEDAKKATDFDDMLVDTGLTTENAEKLIKPGDRITIKAPHGDLLNSKVYGAALDDRAGCAVILRAVELIKQSKERPNVDVLFACQEETGGTGASTGSFNAAADESISVDVSFAQAPGISAAKSGKLDAGPMIGISPVLSFDMSEKLQETAKQNNIPYQQEIMGDSTGTDADHIAVSRGGIKAALISVPQRNMHTGVEIVSLKDIENCAKLIANYVIGGGLND